MKLSENYDFLMISHAAILKKARRFPGGLSLKLDYFSSWFICCLLLALAILLLIASLLFLMKVSIHAQIPAKDPPDRTPHVTIIASSPVDALLAPRTAAERFAPSTALLAPSTAGLTVGVGVTSVTTGFVGLLVGST